MKKIFLLFIILLLTGCVKEKVICTLNSEYSETGITKEELTGMFNGDNELVDIEMTYTFVSDARADEMCDLFEMANEYKEKGEKVRYGCSNNTLTIKSYEGVLDNLKLQDNNLIGQSKEHFVNIVSKMGFKCQ